MAMILSSYVISGLVGGIAVGLLRPVVHYRFAAIAVGVIAVLPIALTVRYAHAGAEPWTLGDAVFVAVGSLFIGTMGGLIVHGQLKE